MESQMEKMISLSPKLMPISTKCIPFKYRQAKMNKNNPAVQIQPIDTKSLVSKYSLLCNNSSKELLRHRAEPRKKGSFSCLKDYETCTFENINPNKMRVQRAISNIHQYTEELKNTLVKEYKEKRKKIKSKQKDQQLIKSLKKIGVDNNPEIKESYNALMTKYSNQNMAMKTLNVLYKAIIDDTLHKKEKEDFQLQANKLPIIDRFYITKRRSRFRGDSLPNSQTMALEVPENRKTMSQYYIVPPKEKERKVFEDKPRLLREDVDIIPWSIDQERIE